MDSNNEVTTNVLGTEIAPDNKEPVVITDIKDTITRQRQEIHQEIIENLRNTANNEPVAHEAEADDTELLRFIKEQDDKEQGIKP